MWAEQTVCLVTLVVSSVFFALTFGFPHISADPGGMALFPRLASGAAGLAAALILARGLLQSGVRSAEPGWSTQAPFSLRLKRVARQRTTRAIALSVVYPWFIIKIGFVIATTIYVFLLMKLFQTRAIAAVLYALTVAVGLYIVFVHVLEAYVPPGAWLEWLGV
jgi:hypothetical protein